MTIGRKLLLGFGIVILCAVIGGLFGLNQVNKISMTIRELLGNPESITTPAQAKTLVEAVQKQVEHERSLAVTNSLLFGLLVLGVSALISLYLTRSISRSTQSLSLTADRIAKGDLRQRAQVQTTDEIGHLAKTFNRMAQNLSELMRQVVQAAEQLARSSSQITGASERQVSTIGEQTASINEAAEALQQFQQALQELTAQSRRVAESSQNTHRMAQDGRELVQQGVTRMGEIRGQVEGIARRIRELSEQAEQIGEIVTTVNDISDQTKLLALNASIEAAKAGEDGKGFAVVATQIRELAAETKDSARKITALVSQIQEATQEAVEAGAEGASGVQQGVQDMDRTQRFFEQILVDIRQVMQLMQEIAEKAQQQDAGIRQISGSVTRIDGGMKDTQVQARQTLEEIVKIEKLSKELEGTVSKYKLT